MLDLVGTEDYGMRSLQTPARRRPAHPGAEQRAASRSSTPGASRASASRGSSSSPTATRSSSSRRSPASGPLRVEVAEEFPLEQAARAHELGEEGRVQGKLVLVP